MKKNVLITTALMLGLALAHAGTGSQHAEASSDNSSAIGRGPYEIPDRPLPFVEVVGTGTAEVPDGQVRSWRRSFEPSLKRASRERTGPLWKGYEINEVVTSIEYSFPDIFTTAARSNEPGYDYDVVFTQRPPGQVIAMLQRLPLKTRVRYGAPLSSSELEVAQSAILSEIGDAAGEIQPAVELVTSPQSTILGVFIGGDVSSLPADASELSQHLSQVVVAATSKMGLEVIVQFDQTVEPTRALEVLHGGRSITGCTTAFGAVRPDTGNRGILTAKHCSPLEPYYHVDRYPTGFAHRRSL